MCMYVCMYVYIYIYIYKAKTDRVSVRTHSLCEQVTCRQRWMRAFLATVTGRLFDAEGTAKSNQRHMFHPQQQEPSPINDTCSTHNNKSSFMRF